MLAGAVFFTLVLPVAAVLIPLCAGAAVDGKSGAIEALIFAATARFAVQGCRRFFSGALSIRVQHSLRMAVMRRLQSIDAAEASRLSTGQLVSRCISDLGQIQSMVALIPVVASGVVEVILISAILLWISPVIALVMLAHIPVMFCVAFLSRRRLYPATWLVQQQQATVASHIEQCVSGVRVIKNFAQQPAMISRFDALARVLYGRRMRVGRLTALFQPALSSIPQVMLVATVVVGGWLAQRGALSLGEFLAAATYVTLLARLIRMTASMMVTVFLARAAVHRVEELLELPSRPQPDSAHSDCTPFGIRGVIPGRPGCPSISIDIPAGYWAVITGPAASGKSFVARALAGVDSSASSGLFATFPDATSCPLLDLPEDQRPVIVLDEPFLYSASIGENIRLGTHATESDVWSAARIACADDFITELGGLDTMVGERGLRLSGGQRQRIALARAVLRHPSVLILDDATSAVDATTERQILRNLSDLSDGMSVISINHRLKDGKRGLGVPPDSILITLSEPPHQELWPADPPPPQEKQGEPPAGVEKLADSDLEQPLVQDYTAPLSIRNLSRLVPGLLVAVVASLFVTVIADVSLPSFIRHALDAGVAQEDQSVVNHTAAVALAVVATSWIALSINTVLTTRAGERILYALRVRSFRHLNCLDMRWYEAQSSGQIMTRLTTDIDSLSNFLQTGLSQFIVSLTMLVGVLGMLLYTNLTLTGISALFLPVIALAAWIFKRTASRLYSHARTKISRVNSTFQESVAGLITAQAYGYAPALYRRLEHESAAYCRTRIKAQAAVSVFFPGINWLTNLAQAAILALGSTLVAHGHATQGAVVAFSLYLTVFFTPVQQLSQIFDSFQQAKVGLDRLRGFLNTQPRLVHHCPSPVISPLLPPPMSPAIVFDDVAFSYQMSSGHPSSRDSHQLCSETPDKHLHASRPAVELSHTFEGTTALVGATGAGKSTIAKLISRWYDPQRGTISAGLQAPPLTCGTSDPASAHNPLVDISTIDLQAWRRTVGTVPQEPHLFPTTVAQNIAFGKPDATRVEIERAVSAIGGEGIISTIPGGYLAPIGEHGYGLSAAQRQIIALARAELIQPAVMVLDEATASLPEDVERTIVSAITQAASGRTAIIIAHRLTTAARADRIVVVDRGRIVETGTHSELVQSGGYYARLWNHQV
ncbi:ATP-binding cassette domain-containing protein [Corynebacterium sp. 4HC-13]|nr:ATP-binding cassette domain-containing protein [Corynebacterium anserum]